MFISVFLFVKILNDWNCYWINSYWMSLAIRNEGELVFVNCPLYTKYNVDCFAVSSVQLLSWPNSLWPHGLSHTRLPCASPTPGAYLNSCPSSQWCHPAISSSVIHFSSHLHSFSASGSFPMSLFFTSGGQNIGVSASASDLPMNIQDWFPLGWTSWISMQSRGLSRVFSNTTVQKHQFFSTQLSL